MRRKEEYLITLKSFHIKNYHNSTGEDIKRERRTEEMRGQDQEGETRQKGPMPFREEEYFSLFLKMTQTLF